MADAGHRGELPELGASTPLRSSEELLEAAATWSNPGAVMLQEYIPEEVAEDWIFHGYFNARSECLVGFTGVKYRSWPPYFGATSYRRVVANPELAAESVEFLRRVGYCGIVDMDWRLDRRDGRYRLLDCNPRSARSSGLFETSAGIDVVRAQHLDLTGREVPAGSADRRPRVLRGEPRPAGVAHVPTTSAHARCSSARARSDRAGLVRVGRPAPVRQHGRSSVRTADPGVVARRVRVRPTRARGRRSRALIAAIDSNVWRRSNRSGNSMSKASSSASIKLTLACDVRPAL